jgi:8-oxo-dGTP diphosphatase
MDYTNVDASKPCAACGFYPNRGTGIDALIVINDKLLLIKRKSDPFKDHWALPGGWIDWNFSAEETVVKEVKEETNLEVKSMKLFNVYTKPERHPKQGLTILYIVEAAGTPKAGDDAADIGLFPFDALPSPLGFDHKQMIEEYLKASNDKSTSS